MTSGTGNHILALNRRAADVWESVTGDGLTLIGDPQERVEHLAIAAEESHLTKAIAQVLSHGSRVSIVSADPLPPVLEAILANSGFASAVSEQGLILTSPEPPAVEDVVMAALAGPVATRQYAGVRGTATATASDLGVKHRTLVADSTPQARWVRDFAGTDGDSRQIRVTTPHRHPVTPLDVDGDPRITVDRVDPQPIIAVGDCDEARLQQLVDSSGVGFPVNLAVIHGSGPLSDPVAVVRSARRSIVKQARQSSGVVTMKQAFRSEIDRAATIVDAISRGLPVLADSPDSLLGYVGPRALVVLTNVKRKHFESVFYRDQTAVQLYRAAAMDAWDRGHPVPTGSAPLIPTMGVSIILATMRPEFVPRALEFVNGQAYSNIEVVVAIHGNYEAVKLEQQWREQADVSLRVISVHQSFPLGLVYNEGIRVADGEVISIWDDDDYYGSNHIWDLLIALRESRADLVGKAAEFFYLEGIDLTIQRSPIGRYTETDFIGGSNLTLHRDTALELGGFSPLTLGEDRELISRIRDAGGRTYRDHGYGYLIHRTASGHTWDPGDRYFVNSAVRQWPGLETEASGITGEVG